MKYILLILVRVIRFIFFCILHILAKLWGIIWLGKFNYKQDLYFLTLMYTENFLYKEWYESFWDIAIGRVNFSQQSNRIYERNNYPHYTWYPAVKGKTKLFTYKV